MAIPTVITDLSATIASNSPAGGDQAFPNIDDYLRAAYGFIRQGDTKASDIASAGTVDLGAAVGRIVDVTGTTTITSFGTVAAGIWRIVRFTGALTLTHNATSMILPGGANITTAAGDCLIAVSLGSGNWAVTQYQQANGLVQLVQSGTWTPTLTNVTNVTSSTARTCNYIRVGGMVHFSGTIDVTPTDVNPSTVRCTLPVASNFTSEYDATGTVTALTAVSAARFGNVTADTTNDAITIQLVAGNSGTSMRVNFTGSYRVL